MSELWLFQEIVSFLTGICLSRICLLQEIATLSTFFGGVFVATGVTTYLDKEDWRETKGRKSRVEHILHFNVMFVAGMIWYGCCFYDVFYNEGWLLGVTVLIVISILVGFAIAVFETFVRNLFLFIYKNYIYQEMQ